MSHKEGVIVEERMRIQPVLVAQDRYRESLFRLPNVIGIATGYRERRRKYTDGVVVQVFVSRKFPANDLPDEAIVPSELRLADEEVVLTDVIDAGFFQPVQDTTRYRPVQGGSSIGNMTGVNAGTLGGWAGDDSDSTPVWLTNNHVVTARTNRSAIPGDARIVQPGRLDGGVTPADVIGQTKRIVPIATSPSQATAPTTAVDCAIGTITVDRDDNVIDIAPGIYETRAPVLGDNVQKRGRTTRRTTNGRVTSINAQWMLDYGPTGTNAFARIGTGTSVFNISSTDGAPFCARGDSGSLIFLQAEGELRGTFPVVGLLFAAGGAPFGALTGACEIGAVMNQLNLVSLCTLYVRALIEAGLGSRAELSEETMHSTSRRKEAQLRRFRDRIMMATPIGSDGAKFIGGQIARLAPALFNDELALGYAIKAFGPWIRKGTNLEILDSEIDDETLDNVRRLLRRIARRDPEVAEGAESLASALAEARGHVVGELLGVEGFEPRQSK